MNTITIGPCLGCCGFAGCLIECQQKTGSGTLCGHAEYVNPSDPIKMYRRQTPSGTTIFNYHNAFTACAGLSEQQTYTRSGTYQYDRNTCAETNTQIEHESSTSGYTADVPIPKDPVSLFAGFVYTEVKDQVSRTFKPTPGCNGPGSGSPNTCSGDSKLTLSDEDTESDAADRAAKPMNWLGCTCGTNTCSAYITDRTGSGSLNFGWRKVRTRVNYAGLTMGQNYTATIALARRVLASGGPFIFYATLTIGFTVDGSGASTWQDLPAEAGWETITTGCTLVKS